MSIFCGLPLLTYAIDTDSSGTLSPQEVFYNHCMDLAKVPLFRGLSYLLLCNYEMFFRFQCFQEESLLTRDQLRRTAAIFGHRVYGLTAVMNSSGLRFPKHMVENLEDLLSLNLRHLSCFTTPDYVIYELLPDHLFRLLREFHAGLVQSVTEITNALQASRLQAYLPPLANKFYICPNILQLVRLMKGATAERFDEEFTAYFHSLDPSNVTEEAQIQLTLRREVELGVGYVTRIDDCTEAAVHNTALSQIIHPVIGNIWTKVFGAYHAGSIAFLMAAIEDLVRDMDAEFLSRDLKARMVKLIRDLLGTGPRTDLYTVAKLFRCISKEDTSLVSILTTMTALYGGRKTVLVPPAPREQVYFNPGQREHMNAIFDRAGWHLVVGPHRSGKSCRLLSVLHQRLRGLSATNGDAVWVDFAKIHSETDGFARLASQLFFKRCNTKETMNAVLSALLDSLLPGSVVVFDNICQGHATWKGFLQELFSICAKRPHLVKIVCTNDKTIFASELKSLNITLQTELEVKLMDIDVALDMAQSMTPITYSSNSFVSVDPKALVVASCGLSGEIRYLSSICSLAHCRQLAQDVVDQEANASAIRNSRALCTEMVFQGLSFDEKLLAYCLSLFSRVNFFDMGLGYALLSPYIDGDLTRFRLAWNKLLDIQWIQCHPEFGFVVSPLPTNISISFVTNPGACRAMPVIPTVQKVFDSYLLYWAKELRRINTMADQNPCVMEEFTFRLTHFSVLLQCVFYKPIAKVSYAPESSATDPTSLMDEYFYVSIGSEFKFNSMLISGVAKAECIFVLAGNMGRVLSYHLSGASAYRIASLVDQEIRRLTKGSGVDASELTRFNQLLAASAVDTSALIDGVKIDLAEQCLRQSHITEGIEHARQAATTATSKAMSMPTSDAQKETFAHQVAPYVRALLVFGRLLMADNQTMDASSALKQAAAIYETTEATVENHWEYSLASRLIAETNMMLALKDSLNTSKSETDTKAKGLGKKMGSMIPKLR